MKEALLQLSLLSFFAQNNTAFQRTLMVQKESAMNQMPAISQIALYVKDISKVADFYCRHFGFTATSEAPDKVRLVSKATGCDLVLLQASKGHKIGQSVVKIVFDVQDIEQFKRKCAEEGLKFGVTHSGNGYQFSNARDPAKNLIQISNSRFARL